VPTVNTLVFLIFSITSLSPAETGEKMPLTPIAVITAANKTVLLKNLFIISPFFMNLMQG
jgi:hypothetical protein